MSPFHVTRAKPWHADLLIRDVRRDDLTEWVLASGRPLQPCLAEGIAGSTVARTMWHPEGVLCIWGVTPTPDPLVGRAWLIGTNLGQEHVRRVQRHFREGLSELHAAYPRLDAWAYLGNELHHHWMERLGFERTGEPRVMGLGAPFILFTRETAPCA
ncbi:hypothetical protein [uncultured Methylobacterium sp.]|uniref:hypothetical protein n=1 Tax=uncultured Methylobacterium sp. TaxID=157278 RepID=UPI002636368C|nr:hypothetical protein [uncultured Methylobacterium sp.]